MDKFALSLPGLTGTIAPPGNIPGGSEALPKIIQTGIQALFILALILAVFFLIWGGITWTTSGGDKQGIEAAKKKLTFAIIGLIVTFLAFFIINIVQGFLGIDIL